MMKRKRQGGEEEEEDEQEEEEEQHAPATTTPGQRGEIDEEMMIKEDTDIFLLCERRNPMFLDYRRVLARSELTIYSHF